MRDSNKNPEKTLRLIRALFTIDSASNNMERILCSIRSKYNHTLLFAAVYCAVTGLSMPGFSVYYHDFRVNLGWNHGTGNLAGAIKKPDFYAMAWLQ